MPRVLPNWESSHRVRFNRPVECHDEAAPQRINTLLFVETNIGRSEPLSTLNFGNVRAHDVLGIDNGFIGTMHLLQALQVRQAMLDDGALLSVHVIVKPQELGQRTNFHCIRHRNATSNVVAQTRRRRQTERVVYMNANHRPAMRAILLIDACRLLTLHLSGFEHST